MSTTTYSISLEQYGGNKTRFTCPSCGKHNQFARYVDVEGNYPDVNAGRCNRVNSCGYHQLPNTKTEFKIVKVDREEKPTSYLTTNFENKLNNLTNYLTKLFGPGIQKTLDLFEVQTDDRGYCVFLQKDYEGRTRTAKLMDYTDKGKRNKDNPYSFSWAHTKESEFNLKQCAFGLHLVKKLNPKIIYLVESEKSALVCSFLCKKLFLATGGAQNIGQIKEIRKYTDAPILVIPDSDNFTHWNLKLIDYNLKDVVITPDLSKLSYTEKLNGTDYCDLIFQDLQNGIQPKRSFIYDYPNIEYTTYYLNKEDKFRINKIEDIKEQYDALCKALDTFNPPAINEFVQRSDKFIAFKI